MTITATMRRTFREQGFVVVPGVLTDEQLATGRKLVAAELENTPPAPGHVGIHFTWPRFEDGSHPLLDLYREAVAPLAAELVLPELGVDEPDFAQIATTIPPWPHRPGAPHVDGVTPLPDDGVPFTFSVLAGIWLTDQLEEYNGNLHVWPGTHRRFGEYLAAQGVDALAELSKDTSGAPYPRIELGEQVQTFGTAGSVLFAHYLLGHNIGGNTGPDRRETIYYRLQAGGHRGRWREVVADPLSEFRTE
ncbi:phytanoyl-CoA dioxygenase family protein [Kribbella sp. CA-293567]|uniref:phytanoyl-CoA dioxygenase family protein n=1 Tax=Kribbella sp. CA-293567 TaxID=3002436 RepID=UPI0022DDDE31|nr:phytanoyl-CoA dioxygenase family protein [Kribbella sp. CA-293567]WBQ02654.1 phytanoyl-CoA dioxygenase family protein [Kribbella sp. CA-293567]